MVQGLTFSRPAAAWLTTAPLAAAPLAAAILAAVVVTALLAIRPAQAAPPNPSPPAMPVATGAVSSVIVESGVGRVITLPAPQRRELLDQVRHLLETHPDLAGVEQVAMPYVTRCYRTQRD